MPRILLVNDPVQNAVVAEAAALLREGAVVAFPTETVYGLGADTFNSQAIDKVYDLKGRPTDNPLIAHVLDAAQARDLTDQWDECCGRLARKFWPGPLTMVVEKSPDVPAEATAGRNTIAIRAPDHPVAQALLAQFGSPISAPSANRSGHVSPTTASHVAADFADCDDLLILDGGASDVGIESTVIDLTGDRAVILRPGSITIESLHDELGDVSSSNMTGQGASPGMTLSHYAHHTPTELVSLSRMQERLQSQTEPAIVLARDVTYVESPHRAIEMPSLAEDYAMRLYSALREADSTGCKRIVIEKPEETDGLWAAILDRLQRASRGT